MKALVFGHQNSSVMAPLPTLLSRAGFQVDVISHLEDMRRCKNIDNLYLVGDIFKVVDLAVKKSQNEYNLLVAADDEMIGYILSSRYSKRQKSRLLPVMNMEHFEHLYSKIGLSRTLRRHGVQTPDFAVAANKRQLDAAVRAFRGEVYLKIDASCAGFGVFPCKDEADIDRYRGRLSYPLLVQEKIEGDLIDLSGFFQNGRLIFFHYAETLESRPNALGPSVLRKFQPLSSVGLRIYDQLNALGAALGAHGFTNVTAIRSARDGALYFIEADMRSTVWVEFAKFFDEDPADKIRRYFVNGAYLEPGALNASVEWVDDAESVIAPYAQRLDPDEISQNKYDCQRFKVDYFDAHAPVNPASAGGGARTSSPAWWGMLRRRSA